MATCQVKFPAGQFTGKLPAQVDKLPTGNWLPRAELEIFSRDHDREGDSNIWRERDGKRDKDRDRDSDIDSDRDRENDRDRYSDRDK